MNEYNSSVPHELDWDDEITSDEGQYIILPEGDYAFTVTNFERGRFLGSAKTPACKKATLTLRVDAPEGSVNIKYDLILYSTMEWKISEFFRAIGQKKHGETMRPDWNKAVGATGRVRIKPRTYTKKDGTQGTNNDVDRFYDPETAAPVSAAPTAPVSAAPAAPSYTYGKF